LRDKANKYAGDAARPCTHAKEGSEVVLIVGPVIKPGELERIFEKFHRGGRADRRKAGTGLGLSISRRLVEAMGGTIVATPIAPRPAA
jgi:two-component system, OmpR family, sensor histidine kinase KdpD